MTEPEKQASLRKRALEIKERDHCSLAQATIVAARELTDAKDEDQPE